VASFLRRPPPFLANIAAKEQAPMPARVTRSPTELWIRGQHALGVSYRGLAELIGSSQRTCQRWGAGSSTPLPDRFAQLAGHVHAHDPALAEEIAAVAGASLESLGIVKPAPPPAPPPPLPPPPPPPAQLVENVLFAAAETMDVSPRAIRAAIAAAFARAHELGLDVAAVASVLTPRPAKRSK
jgi:hypothetical protein